MKIFLTAVLFLFTAIHCIAQTPQFIDGYTDKSSYRNSETVTFYTKSTMPLGGSTTFTMYLFNLDGTYTGTSINGFTAYDQGSRPIIANNPWENGYDYQQTNTWIPTNIPSGYYMVKDNNTDLNIYGIPLIIKGDNSTSDIVIVCPTNTINAYTNNPASSPHSLYTLGITTVSFHRPQIRVQYSDCDNGFLDWLRLTFAPTQSYSYNYISDMDLGDITSGWDEIKNAKLLIIPGHSEYWTRQARLNFDRFVDTGKNAVILSGNTMWMQVCYEDKFYNADNTKLSCHRGGNWCAGINCYDEDLNTDHLLATYHWSEPDLKYSIIGSIGSDSWRGGYGDANFSSGGHKIIMSSSPLLTGTSLNNGDAISLYTAQNDEYDGSFMKSDVNGNAVDVSGTLIDGSNINLDPVLDISALGIYHAEMIGYHRTTTNNYVPDDPNPNNLHHSFCPFLIFQKTSSSGIIINVNSNRWCYNDNNDWTTNAGTALRPIITANMINQLINGSNVFSSPAPHYISLKPTYSNVTYIACENGNIHITPDGIYLYNAYKIDNGFVRNPQHFIQNIVQPEVIDFYLNTNVTRIDNNCALYQQLRLARVTNTKNAKDNEQTEDISFSLFPNPATGKFNLQMLSSDNSEKNVYIFNSIYQEIYRKEKTLEQSIVVDFSASTKGIYFVKVAEGNKVVTKKIAIM